MELSKASYTDSDDHILGVFTRTGSVTPALSLACTASSMSEKCTALIRKIGARHGRPYPFKEKSLAAKRAASSDGTLV